MTDASSDYLTHRQAASEAARPSPAQRPRRGLWAAAATLVLVVAVAAAHDAILRALAEALIVDREEGFADAVWLFSGDHRFQAAADLYREDPRRVILVGRSFRGRLVELGILPPREEIARSRLEERGVPASAVEMFGESCRDAWELGRAIRAWLQGHPDSRVLVLCEQFRSRQLLATLGQVLGPEEMARIGVRTLRSYRYDETNWWKVRSGVKQFVAAWLGLGCVWAFGEPAQRPPVWSADEYEAQIARCIGGASR